MNSLKKASIQQSFESYNLSITEAFIMALAAIAALSLQAHAKSENRPPTVGLEQDLSSLAECKASEMTISNRVEQ